VSRDPSAPPAAATPRLLTLDDQVVTGEAVALELPAASVGLRVASGLIDIAVAVGALLVLLFLGGSLVAGTDDALLATMGTVVVVGVLVGIPTTLETLTQGRTLGKQALGLRTVRDDAGPVTFRQAFLRALVGVVEIWLLSGAPALVAALATRRGQRLGDLVAGTYVVRDRFPFPTVRPPAMPPQLAGWAGRADLAPLPDGLALGIRQFLDRAASLNPASRTALAGQLATRALLHVAPLPPPGHHPEAVLAAVMAERRRRDEARLAREAALRARLRGPTSIP
jgi:uncharacterized RDD family membrane protein YckC